MASHLTETLYRFCTDPEMYSYYQQHKASYLWIAKNMVEFGNSNDELVTKKTFQAALTYYAKQHQGLHSVEALTQYIKHNPDHIPEFEQTISYDDELPQLAKWDSDTALDNDVLFATLLTTTREKWLSLGLKYAEKVGMGAMQLTTKGVEKQSGPTVAITWLRSFLVNDFRPEVAALAGLLQDNTDTVIANLESKLSPDERGGRFPLGFWNIDDSVTVGKQNLRFLGILGMSGDGKTTLTNCIVYNWLTQGAHILYVSTEHVPEEVWEFMAFLHQTHDDYDFKLPPLQHWENGLKTGRVKPADHQNMLKVLADIKSRRNLPGLLDCQQMYNWEAIKDYLTVNHKKNKYDILVVDYIGRLEVQGDVKFRNQAVGAMINDAQKLTREFDDNKGIIVLTPIQVNREGNKQARAGGTNGERYNLNAVSQNSEYQWNLDLCLAVYSDEEMKQLNKCEVSQAKVRKGLRFPPVEMTIDRNSGAFRYFIPATSAREVTAETMNTAKQSIEAFVGDVPPMETTTENIESLVDGSKIIEDLEKFMNQDRRGEAA